MSEKKVTFGKIFWPSLVAALIVSIIGTIIWVFAVGSLFSGWETKPFSVKNKTVLHMTLNGVIQDRSSSEFDPGTFAMNENIGLPGILHGLEEAKSDDKIKGIFLEIDELSCGVATAKEIRDAINEFEETSGKFVVAYNSGEYVSMSEYYVASAANESYGFPSSNISFLGLGSELMYFKGLLDDLDVDMQVIRGSDNDFKSAVEPFIRTNMSDSARVQTERLLTSLWQDMREDIATDRNLTPEKLDELAENASVLTVEDAVKHKLIDATKYRDEVLQIIADKINLKKGKELEFVKFAKYANKKFVKDQKRAQRSANIAVILAEGGVAKNGDGLTSDEICKFFREVRNDDDIQTVVFRVNSPGGSALASDEIWREVQLTNEKKPVIISMGDLAASGGYYISAPGTYIFAQPHTITGSIGVFGVIPYTGDMLENKLGLTFDRASTNTHSVLTTNRRLTEDEMKMIQQGVDDIYTQFKQRVADGRGMTVEDVNVVGRGRVWTGRDAKEIGLVDELGGLYDAIDYAAVKQEIKEQKVRYYPEVKENKFAEILEELNEASEMDVTMKNAQLPQELVEYYQRIKTLESYQGIQMRMPFEFVIR